MYRVTIYNGNDSIVIHEPTTNPSDPHLYSCSLTQGASGEIDSLTFEILPNNPGYEQLFSRTTMITVTDLSTTPEMTEFTGRVLMITPQMEESGLVYKQVVAEDRMGFLCDSIQPYTPEATYELADFFTLLLENHNSQVEDYKKIYPGLITVTTSSGNVTKGLNYQTTWEAIKEKLLDSVGGEIQLYSLNGLLYLDYVPELGSRQSQTIELGKNMVSIDQEIDPTTVITRLIPLGAQPEPTEDDPDVDIDNRLTIASVNNGKIYLDDEDAQAVYGIVEGVVYWDDVTLPENLKEKGQEWLDNQTIEDAVTLSALDLSLIGLEYSEIERYNYYRVINPAIGMDTYLRVAKRTVDICEPENITFEMGTQAKSLAATLTDASNKASSAVTDAMAAVNAEISKTVSVLIASDLEVVNANIYNLTAFAENVYSLLAGEISTGILQSIHLTADNVVIDDAVINDAMIVSVTADKLTAGTIYTDYVKIANNEGQQLWIDGATIQMKDDNDIVRVQIGEDNTGDYSLYLWNAAGDLIWDAQGLCEAGLPVGNEAIIRNDQVAEGAAISGSKLDIASVTDYLNEYGQLVMDASKVTINDQTLDAWYVEVTQTLEGFEGLTSEGLMNITPYFAIGLSDTEPPAEAGIYTPSLIDVMELDNTLLGVDEESSTWTTERLTAGEGEYLWVCYQGVYADGHTEWTTPYCLTDGYLRTETSTLQTEFTVVQGQIESKIWQTDITSAMDEYDTVITEKFSDVNQTLDSITSTVGEIESSYESMSARLSTIEQTSEEISASVTAVDEKLDGTIDYFNGEIAVLSDKIELSVTEVRNDLSGDVTALESKITQLADSITLSVSSASNGTASIVLSVDGEESGSGTVVSSAREAFESENTSITISAGTVTFNDNLLIVNGSNFSLDAAGNATFAGELVSPSGTIGGWIIGTSSLYNGTDSMSSETGGLYLGTSGMRNYSGGDYLNITSGYVENGNSDGSYAKLYSATLRLAYQGEELGWYGTNTWAEDTSKRGLNINLEYATDYIAFGRKASADATTYTAAYVINYGIGSSYINDYTERHIFYGAARFTDNLTIGGYAYASRFYPGAGSYYINESSMGGIYTNGCLATVGKVCVGNTDYGYMLNVAGSAYISSDLAVNGSLSIGGGFSVGSDIYIGGGLTVTGTLNVNSGQVYLNGVSLDDYIRSICESSGGNDILISSSVPSSLEDGQICLVYI